MRKENVPFRKILLLTDIIDSRSILVDALALLYHRQEKNAIHISGLYAAICWDAAILERTRQVYQDLNPDLKQASLPCCISWERPSCFPLHQGTTAGSAVDGSTKTGDSSPRNLGVRLATPTVQFQLSSTCASIEANDPTEDRILYFQYPEFMTMYGVIDGHGGSKCANYLLGALPQEIIKQWKTIPGTLNEHVRMDHQDHHYFFLLRRRLMMLCLDDSKGHHRRFPHMRPSISSSKRTRMSCWSLCCTGHFLSYVNQIMNQLMNANQHQDFFDSSFV